MCGTYPGLLDASGAASSVGLLEVYMDGAFGTVCGMDSGAADVVCRMQGYDHGSVGSSPCSSYGGTNLCGKLGSTIAMKDLQCSGGEMELSGSCVVDILRTCFFDSSVLQVQVDCS